MIMEGQKERTNRFWFIHGGALIVFVGLALLFFLLDGGTGEKQPILVDEPANAKVDELPDVVTDEVADNRLDAYNQAAMIIQREEKERELQEEHNSFHFFAEDISNDDETEDLGDDLNNEKELQKIRNIMNGTEEGPASDVSPIRTVMTSKRSNSSQVVPSNASRQQSVSNSEEEEIDLDKLKAREKKDKLKRLKALYYGEEEEEVGENTEERIKEEPQVAATPPPANGFKPIKESSKKEYHGSIRAVIHGEQKNITTASQVDLRILDPVEIEGTVIPRNTTIIGMARFNSNRVYINIENIAYSNNVYPFKGTIYDQDGFQGIYFPNNLVNEAKTEAGSETLTSTNVNVSGLTGIVNTGANALINATKNVVNGSVRETKVTLPANYKLIIKTSGLK